MLLDYKLYLVKIVDINEIDINKESSTLSFTLNKRELSFSIEQSRRVLLDIILSINICVALIFFSISVSITFT